MATLHRSAGLDQIGPQSVSSPPPLYSRNRGPKSKSTRWKQSASHRKRPVSLAPVRIEHKDAEDFIAAAKDLGL